MHVVHRIITSLVTCMLLVSVSALPSLAQRIPESPPVYVGIYSDEWVSAGDITAMGEVTGVLPTFVGTFHHPLEGPQNTNWILEQAWQAGGTPIANLEVNQLSYTIAAEHYDEELRLWAIDVLTWLELGDGRSLVIAPMAEANGDWVSWGMDPLNFQIAFRKIVAVFEEVGLGSDQVRWMFAPNSISAGGRTISDYWPGADYVDILGFSAYNFGGRDWISPADAFDPAVRELTALAPDKPILLAQVGSASEGGDKDQWLTDMFEYIASESQVVGFIYFNLDKERDWKIWRDGELSRGYSAGLAEVDARYGQPLTGWFRPGRVLMDPLAALPIPQRILSPAFTSDQLRALRSYGADNEVRPE